MTEYKVYRNGTQVGTPSGTSYSDSGLASATTYSYTVAACDAAGNCSAQSTAVLATTPDNVSPTVPADLAASAVGATQINLNWTASTDNVGVTEYKVYRNGTQVGTPSVTSYSDTGLASATTYSYTVAACDAAGNCSAQSTPPVSVTTPDNIAPSVPTGLVASAVDATQINLAWNASTDNVAVTAYKVYRNTLLIATLGNVLSYSNTGLTSATTYSYTVAACDAAANCSVPSSPPVSATTPNATGPDLIVTILTASIKNGQLKIADQVKNQGTGAAGSFKIGFYLSLNTVLDGPDIFITCTRSITSLAVNTSNPTGTKTAATSCTIPGTATKGANYVIGVTDYLNAVGEVSETNNNKTTATQVTIP